MGAHGYHFVQRLSMCVCLSGSHTFLVVTHSYVSQATHAFLGLLPFLFDVRSISLNVTFSGASYQSSSQPQVRNPAYTSTGTSRNPAYSSSSYTHRSQTPAEPSASEALIRPEPAAPPPPAVSTTIPPPPSYEEVMSGKYSRIEVHVHF